VKNVNIILIIFFLGVSFGNGSENIELTANQNSAKEIVNTVCIQFINAKRVVVIFHRDFFSATLITPSDSTSIVVPFGVDEDKQILCNECIRVRSCAKDTSVDALFFTDKLFLLPLLDFAGKLFVFGLDFESKKHGLSDGQTEVYLTTTLPAFVVSPEKSTIIVTDGFDYNHKGIITHVVAHEMKIIGTKITEKNHHVIPVPPTIQSVDTLKKFLLNRVIKSNYLARPLNSPQGDL
jgi:hypothetical protein